MLSCVSIMLLFFLFYYGLGVCSLSLSSSLCSIRSTLFLFHFSINFSLPYGLFNEGAKVVRMVLCLDMCAGVCVCIRVRL